MRTPGVTCRTEVSTEKDSTGEVSKEKRRWLEMAGTQAMSSRERPAWMAAA